jgi:hypothetical protein
MDIRVYLNNGDILDFSQLDSALVQATIAELQAGKLFAGNSLILGSGASCTLLPPSAISRIDVLTGLPVSFPQTLGSNTALIEDEEVFRLRAKAATTAFHEGVAPGEQFTGYVGFDMLGGHRLMLEVERVLQNQLQFFTNLHHLLEIPVMAFPHPRGGAIFVNVVNVSALSTAPGFAEYPKGTWLVEAH